MSTYTIISKTDKTQTGTKHQRTSKPNPAADMSDRRPDWWFVPDDLSDDDIEMANLLLDMQEGRPMSDLREAVEESSSDEESDRASSVQQEDSNVGNNSGTYQPPSSGAAGTGQSSASTTRTTTQASTTASGSAASTTTATTGTPASVLPQGETWKYQQPMAQPLGYLVAADANGNERERIYQHQVDFNDRASVNKANKARREEVYRARVRYGLPLARESMRGREVTETHFDWIAIAHEAYAILHDGL